MTINPCFLVTKPAIISSLLFKCWQYIALIYWKIAKLATIYAFIFKKLELQQKKTPFQAK